MASLRPERPRAACPECGEQRVHLSKHINDVHTRIKTYQCEIDGCEYKATQKSNLLGHQSRKHKLRSQMGDTVAPPSGGTFIPHPAAMQSSNATHDGPSDGTAPENYAAQYDGAAFAASGVDAEPSLGPQFPAYMVNAPFLAPRPLPTEDSNLGPCQVASMDEGLTQLGPPPPFWWLSDNARAYARITPHAYLATHRDEAAVPITNNGVEPHSNISMAQFAYTEAELYQIFGDAENTSAGHYEWVWPGAGGA